MEVVLTKICRESSSKVGIKREGMRTSPSKQTILGWYMRLKSTWVNFVAFLGRSGGFPRNGTNVCCDGITQETFWKKLEEVIEQERTSNPLAETPEEG